jgi:hypothetical protein
MTLNNSPSVVILRSTCNDGAPQHSSLPLSCDLAILPEIHGSNEVHIHVLQQALNPCGIDNVLVLHHLQQGQGYLMSLSNCLTHAKEHNRMSVQPYPSTFYFALLPTGSSSNKNNGDIMVTTKQSSAELDVVFDMTPVLELLASNQEQPETYLSPPPITYDDEKTSTCRTPVYNNAQVLRFLETLTERETKDADLMVASLGVVLVALVALYGWTVYSILLTTNAHSRKRKTTKKIASARTALHSSSKSLAAYPTSVDGDTLRAKTDEPPIDAVIIDRMHLDDAPSLVEETCDHVDKQKNGSFTPGCDILTSLLVPLDISKPLSPCSQLERDWEEKKATRRSRRCTRQIRFHAPMKPIAVPEDIPLTVDTFVIKQTNRIVPHIDMSNGETTSDIPFYPTSISDDSFLNDYW